MSVNEITSKKQFDELTSSGKVIFVDFYADWCGPCRMISPVFKQLAVDESKEGAVEFYKVDIDKVGDLATTLGIRSIPVFHAYKGGKCIDTLVGANRSALTDLVVKSLAVPNT